MLELWPHIDLFQGRSGVGDPLRVLFTPLQQELSLILQLMNVEANARVNKQHLLWHIIHEHYKDRKSFPAIKTKCCANNFQTFDL